MQRAGGVGLTALVFGLSALYLFFHYSDLLVPLPSWRCRSSGGSDPPSAPVVGDSRSRLNCFRLFSSAPKHLRGFTAKMLCLFALWQCRTSASSVQAGAFHLEVLAALPHRRSCDVPRCCST